MKSVDSDSFIERQKRLIKLRWKQMADDLEVLAASPDSILHGNMTVLETIERLRNSNPE